MNVSAFPLRLGSALLALACIAGSAAGQETDCNGNGLDDALDLLDLETATAADNCAQAPEIGTGLTYSGTTAGSTNDVSVVSCASASNAPDVWYRYTPAFSGTFLAELCGSSYDTALAIYATCPTTGAEPLVCNDDSCGVHSRVQLNVVAGQSYLIRVAGYNGNTGTFNLTVNGPPSLFGSSLDLNGNNIPDECETTVYSIPRRLDLQVAERDELSSQTLILGLNDDSPTTVTISEDAPWLSVEPGSLNLDPDTTATLEVNFNTQVAPLGNSTAFITVQDTGNTTNTLTIPVRLRRYQPPPAIYVDPSYTQLTVRQGESLPPQHVVVSNVGGSPLLLEAFTFPSGTGSWINVTPETGTIPQDQSTTLTVNLAPQTLLPGRHFGYVYVFDQQDRTPGVASIFDLTVLLPDCNGNGEDDPLDIATGFSQDCNRNGIPDECEIADGTAADVNQNGVPDSCEPADCNETAYYEGFSGAGVPIDWHIRTTGDGRVRVVQQEENGVLVLDDSAGPEHVIFETDFETTDSLNLFTIRSTSANGIPDFRAFLYDYSTYDGPVPGSGRARPVFIPNAPFSGEDAPATPTMALRLEVNQLDAIAANAGVTVYPATRDAESMPAFSLRFDAFMNYAGIGSASGGSASGVGTTEHLGAGLASNTSTAVWPIASNSPDFTPLSAWWWAMTGDGGVSADYTYYEASASDSGQPAIAVADSAAPNWWGNGSAHLNNNASLWRQFFNTPAYEGSGAPGKEWVTVELSYEAGVATLYMTPAEGNFAGIRTLVAQWNPGQGGTGLQGVPKSGTPFISYFDMFNSITSAPEDQFALIDNVRLVENPGNDISSLNQATFCVDLEGQEDVVLEFKARVFTTEHHAATSPLGNDTPYNGVLASTDFGRTWHAVHTFTEQTTETLTQFVVDLDDAFTSNSLSYTGSTWIRFSQFGNDEDGGLQIDDVRVYSVTNQPPAISAHFVDPHIIAVEGQNAESIPLHVYNAGGGILNYTLSTETPWIVLPVTSGDSIGEHDVIPVQFDTASVAQGTHLGIITVSADGAEPVEVQVVLHILAGQSRTYTFDGDAGDEGWTFVNPVLPGFLSATGEYVAETGQLDILTSGTVSFGFWESPITKVHHSEVPTGTSPLYSVAMTITGDAAEAASAPNVRIRTSSINFHQTDVMTVTSYPGTTDNRLAYVPSVNPRVYTHLFTNPLGFDGLRLDFDVLVADPEDALPARTSLHSVVLTASPQPNGAGATVASYDFRNGETHGFTARSAEPALAVPQRMDPTAEGLLISNLSDSPAPAAKDDTSPVARFGFWGYEATGVQLQGGKLYRMDATVLSEAPAGAEIDVAVFRLRLNTSSLILSAVTNIDSKPATLALIPNAATPRTYTTWFRLPHELNGDTAIFSFDYLEDGESGPQVYGVILQDLTLRRMD